MQYLSVIRRGLGGLAVMAGLLPLLAQARPLIEAAQDQTRLHQAIRQFELSGGSVDVNGFTLRRDRVQMTFTGTFYFAGTIDNRITGAVFVGQGSMRAEVPPSEFEREHVRRMVGAELVESDFRTAVLRWTDDTYEAIGGSRTEGGTAPVDAQRLAAEFESRLTHDTGVNLASRLAVSILNGESPGLFFVQFDGGRRGRFNAIVDHQHRLPVSHFGINGGEKGLVFAYRSIIHTTEVWMAFYSEQDYARGTASYSDVDNLADITHYGVAIDVTRPEERLRFTARIDLTPAGPARALPFIIGEGLSTFQDQRLEAQLRVTGARLHGAPLAWSQEDWESGFTVYPSAPLEAGRSVTVEVDVEGKFLQSSDLVRGAYYPISNQAWLPRHGDLDRATFDLTYTHRARDRVASIGTRLSEAPDPANPELVVTTYRMPDPVALAVFAVGPFERHRQDVTFEAGGRTIPLEFNKLPDSRGPIAAVKEDFVLAELDNSVRYFAAIFGPYPYETFGAAFHPYPFGQGFPTLMMLAPADRAATSTYAFISHETAHQWWGNIVAWRSYRDQWLSEGFAEYSGVLYTGLREHQRAASELVRDMRRALVQPPRTLQGFGRGRLNDIGPIILGRRLNSTESFGAYQALVYSKGGLVLRMLHFLLSDPAQDPIASNDGTFNRMMTAFTERHRNGAASTDNFRAVASEHFRSTTASLRMGTPNLNWFFRQWVYQTGLPSYRLEYALEDQAGGGTLVTGTLFQDNVAADWTMPLPVVFTFAGDRVGRALVVARGPSTPVELRLPERPRTVELDPDAWVLSEKTETRRR
jgi:hypothetical protein